MSDQMTPADAESWQKGVMASGDDFAPDDMTAHVANIATRTIAADRLEYGVMVDYERYGEGSGMWWDEKTGEEWGSRGWAERELDHLCATPLEAHQMPAEYRLVARRVSEPWEVKL